MLPALLLATALAAASANEAHPPPVAPPPVSQPAALAVIAVAADGAPPAPLVEMTHQLRGACRERAAAVQDLREMRARLLGDRASASLAELERALAGALLTAAHGDHAAAARTLRGIAGEVERAPESDEAFALWTRAQLRVAHAELAAGRPREYREALERAAEVDPRVRADPDQYSPTFRRDLEAARARVAARPHHALEIAVSAAGPALPPPAVFVDGRPVGLAPVSLRVPAGRHRVGAAAGALRVPAVEVDVGAEGAAVALDLDLAAAVNVDGGPALAVPLAERDAAIVEVGAWLGADRVLATSLAADAGATFLVGGLYDVRRGALLREGRVRTAAGLAAPEHVAALSTFLLTGQASPAVLAAGAPVPAVDLAVRPATPGVARRSWTRPAALGSAAVAAGAGAFAIHQLLSARGADADAAALVRSDGAIAGDPAAYARHRSTAAAARRNAWIGAAGTAAFAAAAGVLGYLSWDEGRPVVRF